MKTIKEGNKNYLVLKADKNGWVNCPFCEQKHKHGAGGGSGHRVAHCSKPTKPIYFEGKQHLKEDGYYVQFQ